MVELIVGVQGTGKTKTLIDLANNTARESDGCVVCIEKGEKLRFDISHAVRLVNTEEFDMQAADSLYGMICGLYAANYDITHVFIDSALKICSKDMEEFKEFVLRAVRLSNKLGFKCIMTASTEKDALAEDIKQYVIEI